MPATLAQRMWSTLFDSLAVILWVVLATLLQPWPDGSPGCLKLAIWLVPPLLVEPTSVWLTGRTMGQSLLGLRVLSARPDRLGPVRLYARHLSKLPFLGLSPLYIPFSRRGQAIHDAMFGTVVVAEPLPRGFSLPAAEPFLWRPFASALLAAGLTSFLVGMFLAIVFELSGLGRSPRSFAAAAFELCISFTMGGVFLGTIVRRGHRALAARVPEGAIDAGPASE